MKKLIFIIYSIFFINCTFSQSFDKLSLRLNFNGTLDNFRDIEKEMDVEDFYYSAGTEVELSYSFFNNFSVSVFGQYNAIGHYSMYYDTIKTSLVDYISDNINIEQKHLFISEMKQIGTSFGYKFRPKGRIVPFANFRISHLTFTPYTQAQKSSDSRTSSYILNYPTIQGYDYDDNVKRSIQNFFPQQKFINFGTEIGIEIMMSNTIYFIFSARLDNLKKKVNYEAIEAVSFENENIVGLKYSSAPLNNYYFNFGVRFNLLNSKK
jgi:hypothetical protein